MKKLEIVAIGGHQLTVEFEDESALDKQLERTLPVPEGGKPAGFTEALRKAGELTEDAGTALKAMITAVAQTTSDALLATDADEWSVELNIGFGGKVSPIPTIVSGEATASIKIQARWKRAPPK